MFGKSSILFPLSSSRNDPRSGTVSWKSNYDGICIRKHLSRRRLGFTFHPRRYVRRCPNQPSFPSSLSILFPSAIFRHNATSLWTGTFNSIWPHRLPYVCMCLYVCVCVCVPEQVLSSFRLTLLVQTRWTVWRFEPVPLFPSLSRFTLQLNYDSLT